MLFASWPLLLLLLLPRLGNGIAVLIAKRVRGTLDHQIPDKLPLTAGEWLEQRLKRFSYNIVAVVTDKQEDAYRPVDKVIQLREQTHFKADPVYWATAAHELGHALTRHERPWIGTARTWSAYVCEMLVAAGTAMLLGHILFTVPLASTLAFWAFVLAAVSRIPVLVDEAVASIVANRELGTAGLGRAHLRAARWVLVTSWLTYFATYAGYALLLTQWSAVRPHTPVPNDFSTSQWVTVACLSIACVASAVLKLVEMFAPNELPPFVKWIVWIPITALIYIAWDHRVDPLWAWCVIAALASSSSVVHVLLQFVTVVPELIFDRILRRFAGPGIEQSPRYLRALRNGRREVRAGNARLDVLASHWRDNPPWPVRITGLTALLYLPLLLAIWL